MSASIAPRGRDAGRVPLTATYRLQLNRNFTLLDARDLVPYLDSLGVSHLYCSPVLAARRGSMHGYDVADPLRVNPELGTEQDLVELSTALHERRMGLLLDIVPNHMGTGPDNPYWEDVLAHGEHSRYARWFDIDWRRGDGKVVLPVLLDELDRVLARGDIGIDPGAVGPRLRYSELTFPLDAATWTPELELIHRDPMATGDASALVKSSVTGSLRRGDAIGALLAAQHYRLTSWKHAAREVNYRRFFDVNDLVGLRMEDPGVFADTHALVLRWVSEGVVDGLRVDHVDGLRDPLAYLTRLRESAGTRDWRLGAGHGDPESPVPVFVEKILSTGERLREEWPVEGTTGYEVLNDLEDLFIAPTGYRHLERIYRAMRRMPAELDFGDYAHEGKVRVLRDALAGDVDRLGQLLEQAARGDEDQAAVNDGIVQFIAGLPVYRTYVDGRHVSTHPDDRAAIDRALAVCRRRAPESVGIAERVSSVLAAPNDSGGDGDASARAAASETRLDFVARLQQASPAAAAKGVEDTAIYQYIPLVSRNEVGGAPDRDLTSAVDRFHASNGHRAMRWPRSLVCTNTHDTKRSADLRARLDVLSELPNVWHRHLLRWRRLNRRHRSVVRGRLAPDTNTEYLLYQTLVGLWPAPRPDRRADDLPDRDWLERMGRRLRDYALKAAREAKLRTSWTEPDERYEHALERFVTSVLEPTADAPFLADMARFVARLAPAGTLNSLSRLLLHLTAPGTPDLYQGDELWDFTLVDPDNRGPVDYSERRRALAEVEAGSEIPSVADPRIKLFVTHEVLRVRRTHWELFARGGYEPLMVSGNRAESIVAFSRSLGEQCAIAIAPRLLAAQFVGRRRSAGASQLPTGKERVRGPEFIEWGNTSINLPIREGRRIRRWRSVLAKVDHTLQPGQPLRAAAVLQPLPLALLLSSN